VASLKYYQRDMDNLIGGLNLNMNWGQREKETSKKERDRAECNLCVAEEKIVEVSTWKGRFLTEVITTGGEVAGEG